MFKRIKQVIEDAKLGKFIRRVTDGGESITIRPAPIHGPDPTAKIAVMIKKGNNAMMESLLNDTHELCKFYYPAVNSTSRAVHSDIKEFRALTMEQAAENAGVTVATIERLCNEGKLTTYLCTMHGHKEPVTLIDFTDLELLLMNEAWEYGV